MNINAFILGLVVGLIVGESVIFALLCTGMKFNDKKNEIRREEERNDSI